MSGSGDVQIALLRGINVGGRGKLPMAELRDILTALGARDATTYIQSGNAVFRGRLAAIQIAGAIEAAHGFQPQVVVLTRDALNAAIAANPFRCAEATPKALHFFFLAAPAAPDAGALDALRAADEDWRLLGRVFYLHAPSGIGRSKLAERAERLLGVAVTARNWNTVARLADLASGL